MDSWDPAATPRMLRRIAVLSVPLPIVSVNNQVKEKQWKWSIVIPYDVYQQQVPPKLPKNAVLCSNGCFISSFLLYFIDIHIYLSFNVPHMIE